MMRLFIEVFKLLVILVRRTSYFHQTKSVDEEPLASGRPKAY
jgi:hypothetical protein